jgi:hypothetical protein
MHDFSYVAKDPDARVLVLSQRLFHPLVSRCLIFEFEDVVCDCDRVDVIAPRTSLEPIWRWTRLCAKAERRLGAALPIAWVRPPYTDRKYELLCVHTQTLSDLLSLGSLRRWTAAAHTSVCLISEVWRSRIPNDRGAVAALRAIDRLFVSCQGSAEMLSELTGRPCSYIPPAVDVLHFCPYPDPPKRDIDIYNMGRRLAGVHDAMLTVSQQRGLTYQYDATHGDPPVDDIRRHRRELAETLKRTRFFVTYSAKINCPEETAGQEEIGYRFVEGAAAGTIMIGRAPRTPAFNEIFGWPDVVVPLSEEGNNLAELLDTVGGDAEREEQIRTTNILQCLRQHDWAHRWKTILSAIDLQPLPKLESRLAEIGQRAKLVREAHGGAVGR